MNKLEWETDSVAKRSVETFDVIVCVIQATGYIMCEKDHCLIAVSYS